MAPPWSIQGMSKSRRVLVPPPGLVHTIALPRASAPLWPRHSAPPAVYRSADVARSSSPVFARCPPVNLRHRAFDCELVPIRPATSRFPCRKLSALAIDFPATRSPARSPPSPPPPPFRKAAAPRPFHPRRLASSCPPALPHYARRSPMRLLPFRNVQSGCHTLWPAR